MGALGDIGSVLAYGLGTGANTRADELRKQSELVRKEGLARLRQDFDQENNQQRHDFAIDEADHRNRQATSRDDTRYDRDLGIAKMRDRSAMERLDWQAKHRAPGALQQKVNTLRTLFGDDTTKELIRQNMTKGNSGQFLTDAKRRLDILAKAGMPTSMLKLQEMVSGDPDYIAYKTKQKKEAKGSTWNPFDNKEPEIMPPGEWAKSNKPQLYAAAVDGEQLLQQVTGGPKAPEGAGALGRPASSESKKSQGQKEIKSKEDLAGVMKVLEPLRGMELERALQEARATFDEKSYQSILESLGLAPKKTSILDRPSPEVSLGDIAGALTRGVGKAGKGAYNMLDETGKQLTASEKALLNLNNRVGNYITDRVKEAYLPKK